MTTKISADRQTFVWPVRLLFVALICTTGALPAIAQRDASDIPTVTHAYAIEGATIVQAPGRIIEKGTVIIRDGVIVAVGENLEVPYDAERIQADSMIVYAAFIDGLSTTGVPKPEQRENAPTRVDDPGNPPDDLAGIQPQRDVITFLSAEEKSISELREIGFGAAHVVPNGRMFPGTSAIVLLGGADPNRMVLRGDVAMFVQFAGARGMYPGTPMGMTAKMRQLYREATRRLELENQFRANPAGVSRPEYDEVHYAFFPVIQKQKPVFFFVDDALEIHRALKLQSDLGFSLMLSGLNEAFDTVDELSNSGAPLFVTLNLPDRPKWMADIKRDSIDTILASYTVDTRVATYRDLEAEKRNLEAGQLISRDRYSGVASTLKDAGLTFGFSTMGAKAADIRGNLREVISRGLSEDEALAALTTDAAELLGLSGSLGSVDVGKIANLFVADGPVFEEKSHIKYVFVDGHKYVYEKKKPKKEDEGESENIAGTWSFTAETPEGAQTGTVVFTLKGDTYSGTMSYDAAPTSLDLFDITFDGEMLSFSWIDFEGGIMTVEGTVTGDHFDGIAIIEGEQMSVTGTRSQDPS